MPKHAEKLPVAGFMYVAQRLINNFKQIAENIIHITYDIVISQTKYYNSL